MNPGKHGIFGFYGRQQRTYNIEPVTDSDVHARRLWDYTTEQDLTSLIVNVPVTHPGREIDGAIVPGYLAGDVPDTYPKDVLQEVGLSDYSVYAPSEGKDGEHDRLLTEWLELTESRSVLAKSLMDAYDWDVLFLEFQKTDGAMHKFDDRSKVKQIFEHVDNCMADVLAEVSGDPNIFVLSDHGIGQQKDWSVALNTWLRDEGYLTTTKGSTESNDWIEDATDTGGESSDHTLAGTLLGGLQRAGITVQQVERVLAKAGLYDLASSLAPDSATDALGEEVVDREQSTAFYEGMGFSGVDVGVVLNDDRFYRDGVVSEAEYDQVRDELMDALEAMSGPDGRPFESVHAREDVYHGPRTEFAPDIILEQAERYVIGSQYPRGKTFIPAEEGRIDHTRHGMLVAAGPDIEPEWSLPATPSIFDVTPTVLHLLGADLNERFDGDVLESLLTVSSEPTWREYDMYQSATKAELTDEEEEELRERLQGMGYLE